MAEHDIKTNLDLHSLSIGSDENLKDNDVPSWFDPPFLRGSPFDSWYLCYAFHCLISHTHLELGDVLKMKPKNFLPYFEIYLYVENDDAAYEK